MGQNSGRLPGLNLESAEGLGADAQE